MVPVPAAATAPALVRDAIYAGLGTGRRLGLHAAVARVLESSGPAADLSQLSHHWWAALPLGTQARPRPSPTPAGPRDRAMALLAYEEAATHFQRAIDAHERAQRDPDPDLCELVLALGAARAPPAGYRSRPRPSAERRRSAASWACLRLPRRAALGFEGELVTGGDIWEGAAPCWRRAREALGDCVSPLRVRVTAKLADVLAGLEPGPALAALSREVLRTAVQLGDEAGLAAALHARHQALAMRHAAEQAELARRVVARSESAGATTWAMVGRLAGLADLVGRATSPASTPSSPTTPTPPASCAGARPVALGGHAACGRSSTAGSTRCGAGRRGVRAGRPGCSEAGRASGARRPGLLGVVAPGPGR